MTSQALETTTPDIFAEQNWKGPNGETADITRVRIDSSRRFHDDGTNSWFRNAVLSLGNESGTYIPTLEGKDTMLMAVSADGTQALLVERENDQERSHRFDLKESSWVRGETERIRRGTYMDFREDMQIYVGVLSKDRGLETVSAWEPNRDLYRTLKVASLEADKKDKAARGPNKASRVRDYLLGSSATSA